MEAASVRSPGMKEERIEIRASAAEVKRWRAAAKKLGLTLSAWLRMVALQASA
jgi:hypothetical protein